MRIINKTIEVQCGGAVHRTTVLVADKACRRREVRRQEKIRIREKHTTQGSWSCIVANLAEKMQPGTTGHKHTCEQVQGRVRKNFLEKNAVEMV